MNTAADTATPPVVPPTIVVGLGNRLMRDDGIGAYVVDALRARPDRPRGIELADGGTGGISLLHLLHGHRHAVLVDCAHMGLPPGAHAVFEPGDVHSRTCTPRQSLHEGDLLQVLALGRRLGDCPERITIFGIEPALVAPGLTPSPALAARLSAYADAVFALLQRAAAHAVRPPHAPAKKNTCKAPGRWPYSAAATKEAHHADCSCAREGKAGSTGCVQEGDPRQCRRQRTRTGYRTV